jgi:Domain of unknown function (DUF4124)
MNKLAILVIAMLAIGAYFYRDQLMPSQAANQSNQSIYTWKDQAGKTHYSSEKSAVPAHAKKANLPEISIIETDKEELDKQAKRLKEKETPQQSDDAEKPKPPQVRNLALERMESAVDKLKK